MKKIVCNFAPLRFLPYREIGEFVNVGVIVHCPQINYLDFRLLHPRRTGRVKGFFPELDIKIFKTALQGTLRQLNWLRATHEIRPAGQEITPEMALVQIKRFQEIVRRREGLLHFGETGTLLANTAEDGLKYLYGRFVERQFAQKQEFQETIMRKRLDDFLRDWQLNQYYKKNKVVGDQDFHVVMPFVHFTGDVIARAIRPLDLNKDETSEIYQHGGTWVKNMERLKKRGQLPSDVIFTVRIPESGKRLHAANEICEELKQLNVKAIPISDIQRLRAAFEFGLSV